MGGDIQVTCPACRSGGHVPLSFAGKEIHCKKCGKHFTVCGPSLADSISDDTELAPLSEEEVTHCRERYEARVLSKNRNENHHHDHDHDHHDHGHGHGHPNTGHHDHNSARKPAVSHAHESSHHQQPVAAHGHDPKHGV